MIYSKLDKVFAQAAISPSKRRALIHSLKRRRSIATWVAVTVLVAVLLIIATTGSPKFLGFASRALPILTPIIIGLMAGIALMQQDLKMLLLVDGLAAQSRAGEAEGADDRSATASETQ